MGTVGEQTMAHRCGHGRGAHPDVGGAGGEGDAQRGEAGTGATEDPDGQRAGQG